MIRALALLAGLLLPGAVDAQSLPALHDVTGVAAGDVLNIRSEPRAGADRIGTLAHDARDVEVVRMNQAGTWGLVNMQERAGWVSLRYLRPQPSGDYALARRLFCFGTEPFWALTISQGNQAIFSSPGQGETRFSAGLLQAAQGVTGRYALRGAGETGRYTAVIRAGQCTDGMSDTQFGLDTDLLLEGPRGDLQHYAGCCRLESN